MKTRLALVLGLACLALPASAFGQATRTWVSGVGDDANPCSRTAPCKTFGGAINKTAAGGEIDALDPGGYGAVNISKSITIDGGGTLASILASGQTGVIVNGAAIKVTLRNLTINGGTPALPGVHGVNVVNAAAVRIQNVSIFNFGSRGINFVPAASPAQLVVTDSSVYDNVGDAVFISPGTSGPNPSTNRVTIDNANIFGNSGAAIRTTNTPGPNKFVSMNVFNSLVADNAADGIRSEGAGATVRIGANHISGNLGQGLRALSNGKILSFGNNHIADNAIDGTPTGTIAPR